MSEINKTCPACAVRRKPYERGAWKGEQFWHKTCYAKAHGDEPYPCTCTRAESAESETAALREQIGEVREFVGNKHVQKGSLSCFYHDATFPDGEPKCDCVYGKLRAILNKKASDQ